MTAPLPPLVLVVGSLLSWVWLSLGLGARGDPLQPPALLAGAVVIAGALLGVAGNRSLRHPAWGAFALSTLSLFTVAAASGGPSLPSESAETALPPLAIYLRLGWLVMALMIAVVIGDRDSQRAVLFFALFLAGEVTRFPILETQGPGGPEQAVLATLLVAVVALTESAIMAWLIVTFVRGAEKAAFWLLVALLVVHPVVTAWRFVLEPPEGMSGTSLYIQWIQGAEFSLVVLLVVTFLLHRLSLALRRGLE